MAVDIVDFVIETILVKHCEISVCFRLTGIIDYYMQYQV